ncbi:hypothetical protein EC957_008687 [Mortierella hygrophila]|uniref:Uncharacterized protein n=1 Tax=Mortierella hygrophila TaxID=979708 RepID=A0A9P6JXI0_9FUNG|nr:hypothetical protein EC957_008687 [Mortierella hygrophila]
MKSPVIVLTVALALATSAFAAPKVEVIKGGDMQIEETSLLNSLLLRRLPQMLTVIHPCQGHGSRETEDDSQNGTVHANANRVVVNGEIPSNLTDTAALTDVQREVVKYMQEAPRLAADVKRVVQRLIGHFIETLQNRMDRAEEDQRTNLESIETTTDHIVKREVYDSVRNLTDIKVAMPFTPGHLIRFVTDQLAKEMKLMYDRGSLGLQNEEREFVAFFWKRRPLKDRMTHLDTLDNTTVTSTIDLVKWLSGKKPGFLFKNFIADVTPQGLTSRQRRKAGHRAAVKLLSLDQIRNHLDVVNNE